MYIKKVKNRQFDYQPRFYKKELDESEKRKRKLSFRSNYKNSSRTKLPIVYIIMAGIIIYIFLKLNGVI